MPILNYPVGCVYTHTHTHIHIYQFSSVAQLCSTLLRHHRLQHARLPCPSPTPGAYSDSCPLSQWCHPTISSSVIPFSCLQSFPASGSFPMRLLFASGGQSIGVSASACPSDEYSELISLRMDWLDLLAVQGTLKNLLQHHSSKASILWHSAFFTIQLSHPYVTTGVKKKKNISLTRRTTYMCVCVCVCVFPTSWSIHPLMDTQAVSCLSYCEQWSKHGSRKMCFNTWGTDWSMGPESVHCRPLGSHSITLCLCFLSVNKE